jgi:beta-N-acetylhexosaminidase
MIQKEQFIEKLISGMTLEQKVGQCLVLGFVGTTVTPAILKRINDYYPAGIRVGFRWRMRNAVHDPGCTPPQFAYRTIRVPKGTVKDFVPGIPVPHCTGIEYCDFLNTLKQASLNNDLSLPLHITFDMEGDMSADYYRDDIHTFPSWAGIRESDDPEMAYRVTRAVADQLVPIGFSWSHSLVLDTNTNPNNPEIGARSFSSDPAVVAQYGIEAFKGYRDGGMICTGKHFPGRGESVTDAHHGLPVIDISRKELETHLAPFKKLIDEGLPAIMTAHTSYPQIEPQDIPATLSKTILTDILKGELGFKGTITTDAMAMGGIMQRFDLDEACIMALNAGADLLLLREEGGIIEEVIPNIIAAVRGGKVPLERIEDAVRRTLGVKYDYGFFDDVSPVGIKEPARALEGIKSPKTAAVALESAQKAMKVIRDEQNILPLSRSSERIILVEQINSLHEHMNTQRCHPSLLWEEVLKYNDKIGQVEVKMCIDEDDQNRVMARLDQADIIVATNYYDRRASKNCDFISKLASLGKKLIVVTNTHYPMTVRPEFQTVLCSYNSSPEAMNMIAKTLFGE